MKRIAVFLSFTVYCGAVCGEGSTPIIASFFHLISDPKRFENAHLELKGYLDYQLNLYLFPSKDHADMADYASSLSIANIVTGEFDIGHLCGGHYASVEGTLVRTRSWKPPGFWLHQYELRDIKSVRILDESERYSSCYVP